MILTGPAGVGKSTVAEILARRAERAVHLEADAFFNFVRSGFVEPWTPESHEQNRGVMGIVAAAAAGYARGGYFTIVDGIVIPRWFLDPLRGTLRAAGVEADFAVLRAPESTCVERVRSREGDPPIDDHALGGIWSQFTDLGEHEAHVVEVDGMDPEQTAAAVERLRAEGALRLGDG